MNKRIKELIKSAGGISHDDDGNELTPALVGVGLEKFAELIVKECAGLCVSNIADEICGGKGFSDKIKKHFGVEE